MNTPASGNKYILDLLYVNYYDNCEVNYYTLNLKL